MEKPVEILRGPDGGIVSAMYLDTDSGNYIESDGTVAMPEADEGELQSTTETPDAPAAQTDKTVTITEGELALLKDRAESLEHYKAAADREHYRRISAEQEALALQRAAADPDGSQARAESWLVENLPKALSRIPAGSLAANVDVQQANEVSMATGWLKSKFAPADHAKAVRLLPELHGIRRASGYRLSYDQAFEAARQHAQNEATAFGLVSSKPTPPASTQPSFTSEEMAIWGFGDRDAAPTAPTQRRDKPSVTEEERKIFGI